MILMKIVRLPIEVGGAVAFASHIETADHRQAGRGVDVYVVRKATARRFDAGVE